MPPASVEQPKAYCTGGCLTMLTNLSRDESKRLAAIDLLKNPDKGRDDALKK